MDNIIAILRTKRQHYIARLVLYNSAVCLLEVFVYVQGTIIIGWVSTKKERKNTRINKRALFEKCSSTKSSQHELSGDQQATHRIAHAC